MTRIATPLLLTFVCSLSDPANARASVAYIELEQLVAHSDVIVVAIVTRVDEGPKDLLVVDGGFPAVRLAVAQVVESWKGHAVTDIRFVGSPTQDCDIADAAKGEKLVLFLNRVAHSPNMTIAHVGRGRMLLDTVKGTQYAAIDEKIELPAGVRTVDIPQIITIRMPVALSKPGGQGFKTVTITEGVRSIELGLLRDLVRGYVSARASGNLASKVADRAVPGKYAERSAARPRNGSQKSSKPEKLKLPTGVTLGHIPLI